EREQMARTLGDDPVPALQQQAVLVPPADHRDVEVSGERLLAVHSQQAVRGQRDALALEFERAHRLDLDGVTRQSASLLADQDLAGMRRLLQPRGDVDGIACREPFLRARDDLTGGYANATFDAELRERVAH